jgi:hypothetical protein
MILKNRCLPISKLTIEKIIIKNVPKFSKKGRFRPLIEIFEYHDSNPIPNKIYSNHDISSYESDFTLENLNIGIFGDVLISVNHSPKVFH